jgi:hypothetical protein
MGFISDEFLMFLVQLEMREKCLNIHIFVVYTVYECFDNLQVSRDKNRKYAFIKQEWMCGK